MTDSTGRLVGERVAAAEQQIEALDREMIRVRSRLHDLEGDRATLKLLMDQLKSTSMRVTEVAGSVEAVATRAAEKTIALAFTDRDQIKEVHDDRARDRRRTWYQAGTFGLACGTGIVSLAFLLIDRLG